MTPDDINRSQFLAGRVRRYHVWPTITQQTVGEHSARVALIYCEIWGVPRGEVMYHMLTHDHGELFAGDTPYGAKRASLALAQAVNEVEQKGRDILDLYTIKLEKEEYRRFKVCDLLEMWEFGRHEANLGNKYAQPITTSTLEEVWRMLQGHNEDLERVDLWVSWRSRRS